MGFLAPLAGALGSVGNTSDQWAEGSLKADQIKRDRASQQLDMLTRGIQLQELQQRLKQSGVPMSLGHIKLPNGQYVEIKRDPATGRTYADPLNAAPDIESGTRAKDALIGTIKDEDGKKVAGALWDQTMAATGGNTEEAGKVVTQFVTATAKREETTAEKGAAQTATERAQFDERYREGQMMNLKGDDLNAHAMGLKGASSYSFTPGGQRAMRPPAAKAGSGPSTPEDIATYAQGLATNQIKWAQVPKKDVAKVLEFSKTNGLKMPVQPKFDTTAAREAMEDHAVLAQAQGFMPTLAANKDNNQFGYYAMARAEYMAGRAPGNKDTVDTISKLERFKYTAIQNTIKTRNKTLIDAIQQHLPDVWKDSPALIYEKMKSFTDTVQQDADVKQDAMWVYPPDINAPQGGGATPPPGATILNYDPASGTLGGGPQ